jgi:hypothetical protein
VYAFVAYQAPGLMAGAIAVAFPNFGEAFLASRVIGWGRYVPPTLRGGSSSSNTSGSVPTRPAVGAATSRGSGGGAGPRAPGKRA